MNVSRYRMTGKVFIEIFRTQLDTNLGMAVKIDRPLKAFRCKAGFLKKCYRQFDGFSSNYKINILSNHGFSRPMIHRNASDCAPSEIGSLKTIDKTHDIVCAACSLPVKKFLWGHFVILE